MRYFNYLSEGDRSSLFSRQSEPFYKTTDRDALRIAVGGLLYIPGVNQTIAHIIIRGKVQGLSSMAICLEDSVGDQERENAVENTGRQLEQLDRAVGEGILPRDCMPLLFVRVKDADMLERMEGRYGLIVSNPPYLSDEEYAAMEEGIKNSEPALALRGGADGLDFYRRIAKQAPANLEPGGHLALEIGCGQAEDVCRLLRQTGFDKIEVFQDYAGLDRMVFARI